jgi:hypothetical protein
VKKTCQNSKSHLNPAVGLGLPHCEHGTIGEVELAIDYDFLHHQSRSTLTLCLACAEKVEEQLKAQSRTTCRTTVYPQNGMAATVRVGSDRYPAEVVRVVSHRCIEIQRWLFRATKDNSQTEMQEYEYLGLDPTCKPVLWTLRNDGRWYPKGAGKKCGMSLGLGHREAYQDPHV